MQFISETQPRRAGMEVVVAAPALTLARGLWSNATIRGALETSAETEQSQPPWRGCRHCCEQSASPRAGRSKRHRGTRGSPPWPRARAHLLCHLPTALRTACGMGASQVSLCLDHASDVFLTSFRTCFCHSGFMW